MMIRRISNWVFGSFFRTIGRLLVYILIGYILSIIISQTGFKLPSLFDVYANTLNFNYSDNGLDFYSGAKIFNCTGASTCNEVDNASVETFVNYVEEVEYQTNNTTQSRIWAMTSSATTFGSNGLAFSLLMSDITFLKNAYYSTTAYVCYSRDVNINLHTVYVGQSYNSFLNSTTQYYTSTISNKISNTSFLTTANTSFQYCRAISFIYQPNLAGNVITIRLTSSNSVGSWVFIGTQTKFIGLQGVSASQVQSIINNSGLATATSVSQIQSSLNSLDTSIDNQTQQQHDDHEETMNTITDNSSTGAQNDASNFFSNFSTNTHGLTGIITAPLNAINSLTSKTCSPLTIPLPFVNQNLTLPCMRPIYENYFGGFMTLYDVITLGIVSYWIMVRIFGLVKDFKNPEHDEIEVVDL